MFLNRVGNPMDINCAPLLIDLLLYSMETDFDFSIVNFPFIYCNMPAVSAYRYMPPVKQNTY